MKGLRWLTECDDEVRRRRKVYLSISTQSTELYKTRDVDPRTRKTPESELRQEAKQTKQKEATTNTAQPVACVDTERKLGGKERSVRHANCR